MSFGFLPPSAAGELAAQADAEERQRPRLHRPEGLIVLAARSGHGRGHLLISDGMVSFHPRRGPEVVNVSRNVQVLDSRLVAQLLLDNGADGVTVSVPRWHRRRLTQALRGAGLTVT